MNNPCGKDCPERTSDCHGTCAKYAEFWEKSEERRRRRAVESSVRSVGYGLRKNFIKKAARIRQGREK